MNIDNIYKKIVKPDFTDDVNVNAISYSSEEKSFIAFICTYTNINDVIEYFSKIGLDVLTAKQMHAYNDNKKSFLYLFLINYSNYEESCKFENKYGCVDLQKTQIHLQELLSA